MHPGLRAGISARRHGGADRTTRLQDWQLTAKLGGRMMPPDWSRGRTLSPSAGGAKQTTLHGPLQRWLGVGSAEEAGISVLVNQGDKLLDGGNVWHRLVTVPLHVLTEPEDSPATRRADEGRLCDRNLNILARSAAVSLPHLKDLHALT